MILERSLPFWALSELGGTLIFFEGGAAPKGPEPTPGGNFIGFGGPAGFPAPGGILVGTFKGVIIGFCLISVSLPGSSIDALINTNGVLETLANLVEYFTERFSFLFLALTFSIMTLNKIA